MTKPAQKEMIESMKLAKENMIAALSRITTLETALSNANDDLAKLSRCFGPNAQMTQYINGSLRGGSILEFIKNAQERISKVLS